MEAKKLGLIDQIERGMTFNVTELIKGDRDILNDPLFGPMSIMDNMNKSIEEYKESLTRRRKDLELSLDEIETITKEAFTRVYNKFLE